MLLKVNEKRILFGLKYVWENELRKTLGKTKESLWSGQSVKGSY